MKLILTFLFCLLMLFASGKTVTVTKLWEYSASTNAKPSWMATDDARSMVVRNGKLYIMMRSAAKVYIIDTKASSINGQISNPATLTLTGYLSGSNCLSFTDDGQLLGGSYAGATLKVSKIDTVTGVTTQVLEKLPASGIGRFDYFSTYGDFSSSGSGYILASTCPSSSLGGTNIYKWTVTNGIIDSNPSTTIVRNTAFGASSIVAPIDNSAFYAMSATTNPELFEMNGNVTAFPSGTFATQSATTSGMAYFSLGSDGYFVRADSRYGAVSFYDITDGVSSATSLGVSTVALGSTANTTSKTTIVAENKTDSVNLYVLVPNNGIAAFSFKVNGGTTLIQENLSKKMFSIQRETSGISVVLKESSSIEVFDTKGQLIDKKEGKEGVTYGFNLNKGIYIIRIGGKTSKFVI